MALHESNGEVDLSKQMGKKRRVDMANIFLRDSVRASSLNGNKPYKLVNRSADFFKEPGLIPGSSGKLYPLNKAKRPFPDFVLNSSSEDISLYYRPKVNYFEKEKIRLHQEDIKAVYAIDDWEDSLAKEIELRKNAQQRAKAAQKHPSLKKRT